MDSALNADATPRLRVIEGFLTFWKGMIPKSPPFGGLLLGVAVLVGLDHRRERRHALVAAEPHHDHALRGAAEPLDLVDRHPNDGPAGRDEHDLIAVAHDAGAGERPLRLGELNRLHAHAAATFDRVVADAGALAVAVLGHDEEVGVVLRDVHRDDLVANTEPHAGDTGGVAAHRTHFSLMETDGLAELRDHEDVVVARGVTNADELVALSHLDGDDPVRTQRSVVGHELGLLDDAVLRAEDEVLRLAEVTGLHDRTHLLPLAEGQEVHDRAAFRLARAERQLVHLEPVDLADIAEEENVVVRRGDEEMLDVVVLLEIHAHDTDAAALLLAVGSDR